MSKLKVQCFGISVDGYGAGPDQGLDHPLGVRGTELMSWFFPTRVFRSMQGQQGGETGIDNEMAERGTLERVARRLDESRLLGTRIVVEPPVYRGVTVVARLRAQARTDPARLQEAATQALYAYFHPTRGGPEGQGWPFGRPVLAGEVFSVLGRLRGTELVEEVRVFGADPVTGERGKAAERLEVAGRRLGGG